MYQTEPPCFTSIQNGSPCKSDWNLTHDDIAPNSALNVFFAVFGY